MIFWTRISGKVFTIKPYALLRMSGYISMFFYNPKTNKVVVEIDEDRLHIVSWAEKGIELHVRVLEAGSIHQLFDTLPTIYSKVIYDSERELFWVECEGAEGVSCADLE